jgi:hypothetical protein
MSGGEIEEKCFSSVVKMLLIQPLKSQKIILPNLKYQLKNKHPPLPKTLQKDTIQLSHMSFTTFVMAV